jgi:hypothetical protein
MGEGGLGLPASSLRLYVDRAEIDVPFRFAVAVEAPTNPKAGLVYFDQTVEALRVYTGQAWIDLK